MKEKSAHISLPYRKQSGIGRAKLLIPWFYEFTPKKIKAAEESFSGFNHGVPSGI
jgi:hypothetical protein